MKLSSQVIEALTKLHPDARKDIRRALDDLNSGRKRDTKALSGPLAGYHRLRVKKYRVIYHFAPSSGELMIRFLDVRSSVYDNFTPPD